MWREPFFRILDITDSRPRPIGEIAAEVARETGVNLMIMRISLRLNYIVAARDKALARIRQERPDLKSACVAAYFHRESSTIRHSWRRSAA